MGLRQSMNITDSLAIETKHIFPSTKKRLLSYTCTIGLLQWWLVHPDKNNINRTSAAIKFYFACTAKSPCNLFLFGDVRWNSILNAGNSFTASTIIQTLSKTEVWYTKLHHYIIRPHTGWNDSIPPKSHPNYIVQAERTENRAVGLKP